MVTIRLKGVNKVRDKRTGEVRYYAWRGKGAPRLKGEPGSPEFHASYVAAHQGLGRPADNGSIKSLVVRYRGSDDYNKDHEPRTKREWGPWLDRIADHFGKLPVRAFDRAEQIKPIIRKWRDKRRATPRQADYGMQVLSALLTFAVNEGKLGANPCFGMPALYESDRSEIIWTDADIIKMQAGCPPWLARMIDLAANTGLRLSDLLKLSWFHIGELEIVIRTGKSGGKIRAFVPLHEDLTMVLADMPRRGGHVLTYDESGRPVTKNGFASAWRRAWEKAEMGEADLHFNDLRGTAATRFYLAGLEIREIAEILGWTQDSVGKIIRRYVGRHAAVKARIARIDESKRRTEIAK